MEIILTKVEPKEKEVLFRLLQYSLFEESETDMNEMNSDAVFEYKYFNSYFEDDDRYAYFIKEKQSNKLLGFVMINSYVLKNDDGHSIAEFLVIPKYRRKGVGKKVAFQIFEKFAGNWEVKPSFGSEKAYLFWKNTIEDYTKNNCRFEDGLFLFSNVDK